MKIACLKSSFTGAATRRTAMTLPEMLTAMSIFILMTAGMLQLHIFGLMQDQVTSSKLGVSDQTRVAFTKLLGEIRASKSFLIGSNSDTNFTAIVTGQSMQGTALKIYPTNDLTHYVLYYFVPNNGANEVRRITNGMTGYDTLVVNINNTNVIFKAEDYLGNLLTGVDNHTVVNTYLEFYQYRYPKTKVGTGYLYDYYKIEFKANSRNFD